MRPDANFDGWVESIVHGVRLFGGVGGPRTFPAPPEAVVDGRRGFDFAQLPISRYAFEITPHLICHLANIKICMIKVKWINVATQYAHENVTNSIVFI